MDKKLKKPNKIENPFRLLNLVKNTRLEGNCKSETSRVK